MVGSSTKGGNGAKHVLNGPHGAKVCYALKFDFDANNNKAKYETLIIGLNLARDIGT